MKRLFIILAAAAIMGSCGIEQSKYGPGGRNACQYVKEQVPELREDIERVEVTGEDSLLSDVMLAFGQVKFAHAGSDFFQGNISREAYQAIIDSTARVLQDVQESWQFGIVVNDSLRALPKYDGCWRKVYQVRVTMKSGDTREVRVLMDDDGTTPRALEANFGRQLEEYQRDILQADRDCRRW